MENWLELNDRDLQAGLPGMKPVLGTSADKSPAPVAGPHVGLVGGPDAVLEFKGPNIPVLEKPPKKVGVGQGCTHFFSMRATYKMTKSK